MERCAPFHIFKYSYCAKEDNLYNKLAKQFEDDYTFAYKIKCSCNNNMFKVYRDEQPTIILECPYCKKRIIAYDLKYYPGATKLAKAFEQHKIVHKGQDLFNVYVVYQYDNEFEEEDDVEFDQNAISWCCIYVECKGELIKIVDDETT